MTGWEWADKQLYHKRTRAIMIRRKIGNNTWLIRRAPNGNGCCVHCGERRQAHIETYDPPRCAHGLTTRYSERGWSIAVRLHNTDVVTYHKNGLVTLNTGGWYTVTTKQRINAYVPKPFNVSSVRGQWKIMIPNTGYKRWEVQNDAHKITYKEYTLPMILADLRGETVGRWHVRGIGSFPTQTEAYLALNEKIGPMVDYWAIVGDFYDGVTLDPSNPNAYFDSPATAINERQDIETMNLVDRYMRGLTPKKWATIVDDARTNGTAGDCLLCQFYGEGSDDNDHLRSHLEERYYMVSLAANAIKKSGYRVDIYIDSLKMVKRQLRKYFLSRLLQGNRQGRIGYKHEYNSPGWR